MIQTALTVKRQGVLAAAWRLEPASNSTEDQRRAEFVHRAFETMEGSPLSILSAAMDSFVRGWSIQELIFNPDWTLRAVHPKDPSCFGLDVDAFGQITGVILRLPGETPVNLPRAKFVVHVHRAGFARPKGRSDLDAAYSHYVAKQSLLNAWKSHLERFASPTVVGKYPVGLPAVQQQALLDALNRLDQNAALTVPSEITIDSLGGSTDASQGFMDAIQFHNREMARAILGQTLTTDEGARVGSLALGKVHMQVLLLQLQALRREFADQVMTEQVIRPIVELHFGPGGVPRFVFEEVAASAFVDGVVK